MLLRGGRWFLECRNRGGSSGARWIDLPGSFPPALWVLYSVRGTPSSLCSPGRALGTVAQWPRGASCSLFLPPTPQLSASRRTCAASGRFWLHDWSYAVPWVEGLVKDGVQSLMLASIDLATILKFLPAFYCVSMRKVGQEDEQVVG